MNRNLIEQRKWFIASVGLLSLLASTACLLVVRSALFVTQRVCKSHDGTTCWGFRPTLNLSITWKVLGSITYTSLDWTCGTYTSSRWSASAGLNLSAAISL